MSNTHPRYTVILPARLHSTRLAQKLLQTVGDKTVLEHSIAVAKSSQAERVIVATDSEALAAIAEPHCEVVISQQAHESGSERLAECCEQLALPDETVIVNLQADEPFAPPSLLDLVAQTLQTQNDCVMATLATPISQAQDINNPDVVKVVCDQRGRALYFSRAPIPYPRDAQTAASADYSPEYPLNYPPHYLHHLGIYAYRAGFLKTYAQLPPSPLESIEKLEQLRVLWHGEHIALAITDAKPPKGIDSAADLAAARTYYADLIKR